MRIIIKKVTVCLILVLSLLVFFTSCVSKYIPNIINTPMFTNAGEFQANIAYGSSDYNGQLGYAITDHIAVMVNGNYNNTVEVYERYNDELRENHRKLYFIEGGLGYYNLFSVNGHYEVFGGYGTGQVDILHNSIDWLDLDPDGNVNNKYNRYFLQPSIGFTRKVIEGNFTTRFVVVQLKPGERILKESWNYLIEPAITARIGFKHIKGIVQIGYSFPLNGELANEVPFDDHDLYGESDRVNRLFFNLGLNFNIGRK